MSKIKKLKHIAHTNYVIDNIKYINFNIVNPNAKSKEYEQTIDDVLNNEKYAYTQIMYNRNPLVYVTTPLMVCPFGLDRKTNIINLQFTNYKTDKIMNSFFEFIKNIEFQQMQYIGLDDDNSDLYLSQIRYPKQFDPNLIVKLPFNYNKYNVDIYHDSFPMSIFNITPFSKMTCDIYIDKIWKYNDRYICKWKVKQIFVH
tara:strand:+ start:698 stop:1297 length:600 start_codon:yes stop_codon:yes gene_type:complete